MSAVMPDASPFSASVDQDVARLRMPPHSNEAEQSVLGGLLIDNLAWDRAGDLITDGDFYRYEHREIFIAISSFLLSYGSCIVPLCRAECSQS